MDILLVAAPQTVSSCLSSMGKARKAGFAAAKNASGMGPKATSKRLGPSKAAPDAADPDLVVMNTNTAMVSAFAVGGGGGGGGRQGGAASLETSSIAKMQQAPDDVTWRTIRTM